ncbi:hypothetical protein [Metaclostridioides mangenotii]|uniref:hypothetical protein n=1 Tax=Metaclostridioides mangenotii TaxID=1540 RepID=UPI0004B05C6A|nr:hypothetical protein [Clostridioides mangenotii]
MLKLGEKIIYELTSDCFDLNGINGFSKTNKNLFITNLGNIVIGEGKDIDDLVGVKYIYSFSENKEKLVSYLKDNKIFVEGIGFSFYLENDGSKKSARADLKMVLGVVDYEMICTNQRDFIFAIKDSATILSIDGSKNFMGGINCDHEKFVFMGSKNRFEIYFSDIERDVVENGYVSLKGYFHIEREGIVARSITIFNDNIKNIIPSNIAETVKENHKIGNLPPESDVVFCKVTGNIQGCDYKNANTLMIRYQGQLIFINKKTKKQILTVDENRCYKLSLVKDLIVFDGKNVFNLYINDKNRDLMKIDSLNDIEDEKVGYTGNHTPFFIEQVDDKLKISKYKDLDILSIDNEKILDIVVDNNKVTVDKGYVETKIVFQNQVVSMYLKKSMTEKLIKDIYRFSKESLLKEMTTEVVFDNWAKAMNDMFLYNFFSNMYYIKEELDKNLASQLNDEIRIDLVNRFYRDIQIQKNDLDLISAYYPIVIEAQNNSMLGKFGVDFNSDTFNVLLNIKSVALDLLDKFYRHLNQIEDSLNKIIFVISEEEHKKYNYRMLKETDSDKLDIFLRQALKKLNHLVKDMYPYYIEEASISIKSVFDSLKKYYVDIKSDDIKDILFDKITETYVFKQLPINEETNYRRKDIIEDMYKLIGNGLNNLDNKKFFIGENTSNTNSTVWNLEYKLLDLSSQVRDEVSTYIEVDLDKEIYENLVEEESIDEISEDESILGEIITEMDIDDESSIDMAFQELDVDIDELDPDLDDVDFDIDIDEDIKELLDDI